MKQILRISSRTSAVLLIFVVVFTSLLALTYALTRDSILASRAAHKMRLIDEVLPREAYDNDLLNSGRPQPGTPELGTDDTTMLYLARREGRPVAVVMEAVAPNGYAGAIRLVVGVRIDGSEPVILGVRVSEHRETPGLGDYIEPRKDRNKAHPWITQFDQLSLSARSPERWQVKKDGGDFDAVTGATISARAVVGATGRALRWATTQREDWLTGKGFGT